MRSEILFLLSHVGVKGMRAWLVVALLAATVASDRAVAQTEGRFELRPAAAAAPGGGPPGDVELLLDDGSQEGAFGLVAGGAARQFLWFNRFEPPAAGRPFAIDEVSVLFPGGAGMAAGAAVEIVIYADSDRDPANGATLLTSFAETIQIADDATFSVYALDPPVVVSPAREVLIGVVGRFVVSGATPPVSPASLDTTVSSRRSWLAVWTGDPPPSPELPPVGFMVLIDDFLPQAAGNWLIRGSGRTLSAIEIPTLGRLGMLVLMALMAFLAVATLRRRRAIAVASFALALLAAGEAASATEIPFFAPPDIADGLDKADHLLNVDVDGDGDLDVVARFFATAIEQLLWYENSLGDGSVWTRHFVAENEDDDRVTALASADLDGDGDVDLLAGRSSPARVEWLENTVGDGTIWAPHTVASVIGGVTSVAAGDLDRDGDLDLLSGDTLGGSLRWHENTAGDASAWTAHDIATEEGRFLEAEIADVDLDGDLDALVASLGNHTVTWYENTAGDASAWAIRAIVASADGFEDTLVASAADLDGDGDNDVLLGTGDGMYWLENAAGEAGTWTAHEISRRSGRTHAADFDGDGDIDAVIAARLFGPIEGAVFWYENAAGDGSSWTERTVTANTGGRPFAVTTGDVDGDGDLDAVATSTDDLDLGGILAWYRNETIHRSAAFARQGLIGRVDSVVSPEVGDLDGDGDDDAVYVRFGPSLSRTIAWGENTTNNASAWPTRTIQVVDGASALAIADVDGDGALDVLVGLFSSVVWYRNSSGDGSTWSGIVVGTGTTPRASDITTGDIDRDGDLDVVVAWRNDGRRLWYENTAGSGTAWTEHDISSAFGNSGTLRLADVDGDGDLDAISVAPRRRGVLWHENQANGATWVDHVVDGTSSSPTTAYPADIDGDGDIDIVAAIRAGARVWWYENTTGDGSTWLPRGIVSGLLEPVESRPADLDADGDLDILIAASATNQVLWSENLAGDGSAWSTHEIAAETILRRAQVADFDGDGDLDVLGNLAPSQQIAHYENRGGQFALSTADQAPPRVVSGGLDALLAITAFHRGRAGDSDLELASLELFFERAPGEEMVTAELRGLVETLSIYLDDGSGAFEPAADTKVASWTALPLVDGRLTVALADGEPAAQVAHGTSRTYFLTARWSADALAQATSSLLVTHITESSSSAEDAGHDIRLTLEWAANLRSSRVQINRPPQARSDLGIAALEDQELVLGAPGVLANDTDPDSDPLIAELVTSPAFAAAFAMAPDGSFSYLPREHRNGSDSFTYRAWDGLAFSSPVSVLIEIAAVADPPRLTVAPALGSGAAPVALSISASLVDSDGSESLSILIADVPTGATLSAGAPLAGGSWQLTPAQLPDLSLTMPPGPAAAFDLSVTATATEASNGDQASQANILPVRFTTDLSVAITDSVDPVIAGSGTGNLTYTVTLTNAGIAAATGIGVSIFPVVSAMAEAFTVESSTATAGTANGFSWTLGSLAVGVTETFEMVITVGPEAPAGGWIELIAHISSVDQPDSNPGNDRAEERTAIVGAVDLSITKDDGQAAVIPGGSTIYTVEARNLGPNDVIGATVTDLFPPALSCSWTCAASAGASCTAGPVTADLVDSVDLPAGTSAIYTVSCSVSEAATGSIVNRATIAPPAGFGDPFDQNDADQDENTVLDLDWGDAPNTEFGPPAAYPTLRIDDGARHGVVAGFHLGEVIDSEADGLPSVSADGDDLDTLEDLDDEDGLRFPSPLVACGEASIGILVTAPGLLDAWVDFDRDGTWDGEDEQIFASHEVFPSRPDPFRVLSFAVPCGAAAGETYARFRFSSAGGLAPTGAAADGEVEDYRIEILGLDYGDAPDPSFPTRLASDGARHVVIAGGPILGATVDAEVDGQGSVAADGDDQAGIDDEDGVVFGAPLLPGFPSQVTVTASSPALVDAWIDFGGDGSWAEAEDRILTAQPVVAGANVLSFSVPAGAVSDLATVARFRLSTAGTASFTGPAADGEVEDVAVRIAPAADLGVTVTDGTDTAVPGTAITYTITVSNAGPNTIAGASVTDAFPPQIAGLSWSCVATGGSICTLGPVAGDIADVVTLEPGDLLTYTATGTIDRAATGTLTNTARVTPPAGTSDPQPGDNQSSDVDALEPAVDLGVTLDDGVTSAVPGTGTSYQLVVTNTGPSDAVAATVDFLPAASLTGPEWSCVATAGSACTPGPVSGGLSDTVTVLVGGRLTYQISADIDPAALGELESAARVRPATGVDDVQAGNDSDDDSDTLTPETDLEITKVDNVDPWPAGKPLVYTISVFNRGPSDATGVVVTDDLPAVLTLVATSGCAEDPAGAPACSLGTLPAGSSAAYTLEAAVAPAPPAKVTNRASVTGTHPDVDLTDNQDEETTTLDAVAPEVVSMTVVAASGAEGPLLGECASIRVAVPAIRVVFSEPMVHAVGAPGSVSDAGSYRLVSAAPGAGFDTESCAAGTGGDGVVAIRDVIYDEESQSATLNLASVADGPHRLLVCGSVSDPAGNPLDGDTGVGSDERVTFRVDRYNLLAGAHFDDYHPTACGLGDWQSTDPGQIELSPVDAQGSPISGSAHGIDPIAGLDLEQCVATPAGRTLDALAEVRTETAPSAVVGVALEVVFFAGATCGGAELDRQVFASAMVGPSGGWMSIAREVISPPGSASARYRVVLDAPFAEPFDGYLDAAFLGSLPLFADGFESGDTAAWSAAVP